MSQAYTKLHYHLVFSTHDRQPLITAEVREPLYQYLGGLVRGERGNLLGAGGMPDHVHLLVHLPPRKSLSDLVRFFKSESSRWMNDRLSDDVFAWQRGYGAFSVSPSQLPTLLRYIQNQEKHHEDRSFASELSALLKKHGIDTKGNLP